jgi:hypothetical protein
MQMRCQKYPYWANFNTFDAIVLSSFEKLGGPLLDHIIFKNQLATCQNHLGQVMEVLENALALATSTTYDRFPYNFKIVQAYFPILDNIVRRH